MGARKERNERRLLVTVGIFLGIAALFGLNHLIASQPSGVATEEASSKQPAKASAQLATHEPPDMDWSTQPVETMKRMRRAARESGGDFRRLSTQDRMMFDSVTGGFGKQWLRELTLHPEKYGVSKP